MSCDRMRPWVSAAIRGPRPGNDDARRPVSRVLSAPVLDAGRPFLWDAPRGAPHATNPDGEAGMPPQPCGCRRPYSVLLPVGFTLPPLLPAARCALAAPFRPCPRGIRRSLRGRCVFCGTVPEVALAGGWPAPYSRGARTFLCRIPGLSPRPAAAVRPSGERDMGTARPLRQAARDWQSNFSTPARRSRVPASASPVIASGRQ